ncbi:hypothetical protein CEW46_27520 [Bacillus cereus]|nr:hypothetical protein CEW46_27520 [Bacillus cereus]
MESKPTRSLLDVINDLETAKLEFSDVLLKELNNNSVSPKLETICNHMMDSVSCTIAYVTEYLDTMSQYHPQVVQEKKEEPTMIAEYIIKIPQLIDRLPGPGSVDSLLKMWFEENVKETNSIKVKFVHADHFDLSTTVRVISRIKSSEFRNYATRLSQDFSQILNALIDVTAHMPEITID